MTDATLANEITPNLVSGLDVPRSARRGREGCLAGCEVGAAPFPPQGAAPPLVSTADNAPAAGSRPPSLLPVAKAVLTIFEGQAVFRISDGSGTDLPEATLFRLRRGMRIVTGGTR